MAGGRPGPGPYEYDPMNGTAAMPAPHSPRRHQCEGEHPAGSAAGRLGIPSFRWQGGQRGYDRPLDSAFVAVQRQGAGGTWTTVDSDLGLNMLWYVNEHGAYYTHWEAPLSAPPGSYRFAVHANHYELTSDPFKLGPSTALSVKRASAGLGKVAITLDYPPAIHHDRVGDPPGDFEESLTARPDHASVGKVTFLVNGRPKTATAGQDGTFTITAAPASQIEVRPGAAQDQYGNANGNDLTFTA